MIKLKIGSRILNNDGQITSMDTAPFLKDSRTFVPIRFISEAMGLNVDWNEKTQEVAIYGRKRYFETEDDAAFDWAMHWNAMSIAMFKEMGGIIYKDDNGYYWGNVKIGRDKEVIWSIPEVRKGVAFIHSHGGGEHWTTKSMSREDFKVADDCKRPLYMVDSGGCLYVYDPSAAIKRQFPVKEGAPCDARHMDTKENSKAMNEYFTSGYHDLVDFDFGYKADYYNKLFMKGLHYLEERAV